jgi:uncharacterized membrane protein
MLRSLYILIGMAVAAYLTRVLGVWFILRREQNGKAMEVLQQLPGIVLTAALAPVLIQSGIGGVVSIALAAALSAKGLNLAISTAVGFGTLLLVKFVLKF